ncbi:Gfo/Idh/MocA family protein [Pelagibius sp.]|uniref:Gfo/Idh/MocA family protein n=1 Tax=Pelagibius sp. TaxID=1931238 RepID=UPI0026234FD1|nr:Gfo/Idh/MocA family oxidoreductase [Pelagibius sp.]
MTETVSIALAGAGLMGRRHAAAIAAVTEARLAAVVDPDTAARDFAGQRGVPWYPDLAGLLENARPDGIVLATPNQLHEAQGLDCVAAGLPMLIEKPVATTVASAQRLVDAADAAGVAILVGHHRRHNPLIRKAKALIDDGAIGRVVAVHGQCWLYKPDDYFDAQWRREAGAGPVFINLIHDIDLLRHLCGEIVSVLARDSRAVRGNAVEDTAAVVLTFENGALGTVLVSDTVVGPWSWEMTAKENPAYPQTDEACYLIGGTHGSLELPNLRLWHQGEERGWWQPITADAIGVTAADPIIQQMRHFCRVVRGIEEPLVSGREAVRSLSVIEAIKAAAR